MTTLAPLTDAEAALLPEGLTIRDFAYTDADYAGIVEVGNLVYPDYAGTAEECKHEDAHSKPQLKRRRWLALRGAQIIGYAEYDQHEGMYHPRLFQLQFVVRPDAQGQGVGKALYATVLEALVTFDPLRLRARTRSDMTRSVRFLEQHGFVEDMRDWESRLDVTTFDPTPYAAHEAAVTASGISIRTAAELIVSDPDHRRKLYELDLELSRDVPAPEQRSDFSQETFDHYVFGSQNFLPEGFFVALDGDRYVGMSNLWKNQTNPTDLYTGLTGVSRAYRRRGIALALKLRAIAYARRNGVKTLKTWNESNNRPMLSINEALGFVKQPAWVSYVKQLKQE